MSVEISFCPICAGKLDTAEDERYPATSRSKRQFVCEDCDTQFLIQVVEEGEEVEEEDERY